MKNGRIPLLVATLLLVPNSTGALEYNSYQFTPKSAINKQANVSKQNSNPYRFKKSRVADSVSGLDQNLQDYVLSAREVFLDTTAYRDEPVRAEFDANWFETYAIDCALGKLAVRTKGEYLEELKERTDLSPDHEDYIPTCFPSRDSWQCIDGYATIDSKGWHLEEPVCFWKAN